MAKIVPSVKIVKKGTQKALFESLMNKTKHGIVSSSSKETEKHEGLESDAVRKCAFSLDLRSIGQSVLDGARRKVVLRGEGYAWAPVSGSFKKLQEVGVLSYLVYFRFKCFVNDWFGLRP